jgi:hypothetical protein
MMEISIKQFIETGKFGPVHIGMTKDAVIRLLGQPDGTIACAKPRSGIHYSYYEFFFDATQTLHAIQNDNYHPQYPELVEFANEIIVIDPWFLRSSTPVKWSYVENLLRHENISYTPREYWGRKALQVLQSRVILDFEDEPQCIGDRRFVGIRLWPEGVAL